MMQTILEYIQKKHITKDLAEHSIYYIGKNRSKGTKYEFSSDELEELMKWVEQDEDFIDLYNDCSNPNYHSMQDAVLDFERFLDEDVYLDTDPAEAHKFYILGHKGEGGYSCMTLSTGKVVNTDNLYTEFKSIINDY